MIKRTVLVLLLSTSISCAALVESAPASVPQPGFISGTVTDMSGDVVPSATVNLEGTLPQDRQSVIANDDGAFQFDKVRPGGSYRVSVKAKGLSNWQSSDLAVNAGQYLLLTDIHLKIELEETSVTVYSSPDEIAVEQVKLEEQQRVLGFIPNFEFPGRLAWH